LPVFSWKGRIRTAVPVREQSYSLPVLTTHPPSSKCDRDWIRTNDRQLRRLLLYPAELRNRKLGGKELAIPTSTCYLRNMYTDLRVTFVNNHLCTSGRNRTGTSITAQGILSPSCLPISPRMHIFWVTNKSKNKS